MIESSKDILNSDDFAPLQKHKAFKGVLAHDQLTHKIGKDEFGVINLDVSTGPGSHWVGYFNSPKHKDVYYYDSFSVQPDDRTIKFLKTSGKKIAYNTSQMQDVMSQRCGWFVYTWLKNMISGMSFYDSLYTNFDQQPSKHNESLVKQ